MPEFFKARLSDYCTPNVSVYLVDGQYVRDNLYLDFTEGGNDQVYSDFIPAGEVWLDNDVNTRELLAVLVHELHERWMMARGMDYDAAHEAANAIEASVREEPDTLMEVLADELAGQPQIEAQPVTAGIKGADMTSMIRKTYTSEVAPVEGKPRVLRFTVSTEAPDRDGEVIKANGWVLDKYRLNPVVLWAHHAGDPPIGKALEITPQAGRLVADVEFPQADVYEFADTVYKLCQGGFLSATSVGFLPIKSQPGKGNVSKEYTSQELLEFSIVPVPSNPEALIHAREAGLITTKDLKVLRRDAKGLLEDIANAPIVDLTGDRPSDTVTKPETTENTIRIPVEPAGKHDGHKVRTMDISAKEGIQALYCVDCKKIITYIFDKAKDWDMDKAKAWIKEHSKKGASQEAIKDELDYLLKIIKQQGIADSGKELAGQLMSEIQRQTGSDMPDTISKSLLVKHKIAIKAALEACKASLDGQKAHHKAHMEALTKCHDGLKAILDGDEQPTDDQKPDDTGKAAQEATQATIDTIVSQTVARVVELSK